MYRLFLLMLGLSPYLLAQAPQPQRPRAYQNGPSINTQRKPNVTPREVLMNMFKAMEKQWFISSYTDAKHVNIQAELSADLPVRAVSRGVEADGNVKFDIDIDGVAAPNGRYRLKVDGDLGDIDMANDLRRKLVASHDFKSFSDSPLRARSKSANLQNYRSWMLRHMNKAKQAILESGNWRMVYTGTGSYQGREVDVVRFYKPNKTKSKQPDRRKPMTLNRIWTFWNDGTYEVWVYKASKLPAVVFYSDPYDNIYANFSIDYDNLWMPMRINFRNNSVDAEGSGEIILSYDSKRMLDGISIKFDSAKGISLSLNATLFFGGEPDPRDFRAAPPFGFRKINRDHLNLMILTQVSGGLLKLKKHGFNIRNFKF